MEIILHIHAFIHGKNVEGEMDKNKIAIGGTEPV